MNTIRRIIVVENIDADFVIVIEAVGSIGIAHQIQRTVSGSECIRLLHESFSNAAIALVSALCYRHSQIDKVDNISVQININARLRSQAIVILTTSVNPPDVQFCYENHANAYNVKPANRILHLQTGEKIFNDYFNGLLLTAERPVAK